MPDKRKYSDRRQYLIAAVKKRRQKIREMALEYGGRQCQICGYDKDQAALEFHHLDESKKDFGLSQNGMTRSWKRTLAEIQKCILVCANCHREIHSGITKLPTNAK